MKPIDFRIRVIELACWAFFALCSLTILYWARANLAQYFGWPDPDWGTWIGAIGTVLTLVGTIWLATEQDRQKRRVATTAARLTAANVYFQMIHNETYINSAHRILRAIFDGRLPLDAEAKHVLELVTLASSRLKQFRPLTPDELQALAVLPNDYAVQLATTQGRVISTLALLEGAEVHSHNLAELREALSTNIQFLTLSEMSLRRASQSMGELVDLTGVQPPP